MTGPVTDLFNNITNLPLILDFLKTTIINEYAIFIILLILIYSIIRKNLFWLCISAIVLIYIGLNLGMI